MIRAYTNSPQHRDALFQAAESRGYPLEVREQLDRDSLGRLDGVTVLVVDLVRPAVAASEVLALLDSVGSEELPPVLYLLSGPADVSLISQAENIVNQDFTFAPITADALGLRLEVLTLLGARRRMALESAITDRLTGLFNRKYFLRRLEEEMYRALRYGYRVGCILADVDFSVTSGQLSEAAGTEAVKTVADYLTGRLRRTDVIARFRFSEFAVLLPDIPVEDSLAVANDLKVKIEGLAVSDNGKPVTLRAAVGHLCFPVEGVRTALDVVDALEDCCLASKGGGGVVDCTGR